MGRVLLCLGEYAKKPYFMERAYVNIYSAEELCYCLMKDTYLVDEEIMKEALPDWLEEECKLEGLAGRLRQMKEAGGALSAYAGLILDYVGYGSQEEIEKAKERLEKEAGLNTYEKRKGRADYLAENKKFVSALKSYDRLLEELPDAEKELRAKIWHNKGVAYAGLFQFRSAAESFRRAYECMGKEEDYAGYLAANRMFMEETEYVNFTAAKERGHEQILEVEKLMEEALAAFEGTQESRMLFTLKVCKEDNSLSYYEETERITDDLKEQYRQMTEEV